MDRGTGLEDEIHDREAETMTDKQTPKGGEEMTTINDIYERLDSIEGDAHEIGSALEEGEFKDQDTSIIRKYALAVLSSLYELRHDIDQFRSEKLKP